MARPRPRTGVSARRRASRRSRRLTRQMQVPKWQQRPRSTSMAATLALKPQGGDTQVETPVPARPGVDEFAGGGLQ
eukprot:8766024-Pyramimonas_sp.AAC.1